MDLITFLMVAIPSGLAVGFGAMHLPASVATNWMNKHLFWRKEALLRRSLINVIAGVKAGEVVLADITTEAMHSLLKGFSEVYGYTYALKTFAKLNNSLVTETLMGESPRIPFLKKMFGLLEEFVVLETSRPPQKLSERHLLWVVWNEKKETYKSNVTLFCVNHEKEVKDFLMDNHTLPSKTKIELEGLTK